jgi:hypothetical protein
LPQLGLWAFVDETQHTKTDMAMIGAENLKNPSNKLKKLGWAVKNESKAT